MSPRAEAFTRERDALLMRSALCRLRLHRAAAGLRSSIPWRLGALPANVAGARARIGFGLALSLVGLARGARILFLAGRVVLLARLATAAIGLVRRAWFTPSPR